MLKSRNLPKETLKKLTQSERGHVSQLKKFIIKNPDQIKSMEVVVSSIKAIPVKVSRQGTGTGAAWKPAEKEATPAPASGQEADVGDISEGELMIASPEKSPVTQTESATSFVTTSEEAEAEAEAKKEHIPGFKVISTMVSGR